MNIDEQPNPEEQAFARADEFKLSDVTLEPFSYTRRSAAVALGLRYWKLEPGELRAIEVGDGKSYIYDGMMADAAIVLWLCAQPIDRVKAARRNPRAFEDEIDAWAEKAEIIGAGMSINGDALSTFFQIVGDVDASTAELAKDDGSKKNHTSAEKPSTSSPLQPAAGARKKARPKS